MKNFRTYQLALSLAKASNSIKLKEPYRDQFDRAMLSICLNLAEGSAKPTQKDQKKFFYIALGSLREVQTVIKMRELTTLEKPADILGAHLFKLCQS